MSSQEIILPKVGTWAERISAAWQSTIVGILDTGAYLIAAKAELAHGEFVSMLERELPFKPSTAQRLMKIAGDERLTNTAHVQLLPPAWGTLYEITKLPDEVFYAKIEDGSIHPEMQRKDVARVTRKLSQQRDEERVMSLVPVAGKHKTLIIDPPWY